MNIICKKYNIDTILKFIKSSYFNFDFLNLKYKNNHEPIYYYYQDNDEHSDILLKYCNYNLINKMREYDLISDTEKEQHNRFYNLFLELLVCHFYLS